MTGPDMSVPRVTGELQLSREQGRMGARGADAAHNPVPGHKHGGQACSRDDGAGCTMLGEPYPYGRG